ncbi:hypothetical protein TNCT_687251, partial [Trichonephila clavata]
RFYDEKTAECGDLYTKNLVDNITIDRAEKWDSFIFEKLNINGIVLHNVHLTGLKTLHQAGNSYLTETGELIFTLLQNIHFAHLVTVFES